MSVVAEDSIPALGLEDGRHAADETVQQLRGETSRWSSCQSDSRLYAPYPSMWMRNAGVRSPELRLKRYCPLECTPQWRYKTIAGRLDANGSCILWPNSRASNRRKAACRYSGQVQRVPFGGRVMQEVKDVDSLLHTNAVPVVVPDAHATCCRGRSSGGDGEVSSMHAWLLTAVGCDVKRRGTHIPYAIWTQAKHVLLVPVQGNKTLWE